MQSMNTMVLASKAYQTCKACEKYEVFEAYETWKTDKAWEHVTWFPFWETMKHVYQIMWNIFLAWEAC